MRRRERQGVQESVFCYFSSATPPANGLQGWRAPALAAGLEPSKPRAVRQQLHWRLSGSAIDQGRVEAENEASAIAGIAKQFSKDPEKLIVVKRGDLR